MKQTVSHIIIIIIFIQSLTAQNDQTSVENAYNEAINYHYSNKDSAYFYYKKTIRLADRQNNLEYLMYAYLYLINANGHYYDLKNYHSNLQKEDSLLHYDKRLDTFSSIAYFKDYLLFDKGHYNYKIKQYAVAKNYFQQLSLKLNSIPQKEVTKDQISMLSSINSFLGSIYKHTGKYELATYIFHKNIAFIDKNRDSIDGWEFRIYNSKKLLSQVFEEKKEFKKANGLLKEVLSFYKTKVSEPRFKNNLLSTYLLLEKNEVTQGKFKQAIRTLEENATFYPNNNPFEREVDVIYGDAYLGLKNYQKAENYYKESLAKTKAYRNHQKHQDVATVYAKLAKLYMQQQEIEKGLTHYQLALQQLANGFNDNNITKNPFPEKVQSKTVLLTILREKLTALFDSYHSTQKASYLINAHQTSKTIINTLDELRPEFESKIDKQFLITETYPSIQKMVTIAFELYKNTEDSTLIDDAFYFMEKSKSILLLEAQRNAEATKYGGVPEVILSKSQQFSANISHLEQEVFNTKTQNQQLIDTLFSLKNYYTHFLSTIEKKYPKYYALKYQSAVVSLNNVQQQLQKNQALFSYLATEDFLYLIVIEAKHKYIYKFPFKEKLKNSIQQLYRKSSKLNIQDASIYNDSYTIYKTIVAPALEKTTATELLIIADDLLNYIPFDALITSKKEHSYLIKTHTVSYASSATLLLEHNKKKSINDNKLLVFAPQFNGKQTTFNQEKTAMNPLLYNEREAQQIARYFNGKIYNGNKASIANFNKEVGKYNLLHFATHASANDEFPDYSYLAFSGDSTTSNLLYVKDLYNYEINADLVTLSACQTGIGKLQKGEGMLSLARAFNYAGASSIITTLWKINDQSTSEIITRFYQNLSNGLSKKEALRQAKLTYLKTSDDPLLNHPYYWSGIVLTGNTMPVTTTHSLWWILLGVVGVVVLGLLYVSFLRKQESY